ncbi:MAG TPA: ATP-binding protein [Acidimicrobiales bacterium]|nr:ATP-binding protein [Acidimicrobiales bacterium]
MTPRTRQQFDGENGWYGLLPQLLDDVGVGLVVEHCGQAVVVNDAFCGLSGYASAELLASRALRSVFAPEDRDALAEAAARRASSGDGPQPLEAAIVRGDGRRVPVEVTARLVVRDGRPEIVATFRDLTDRDRPESVSRARQQEVVAELGRQALVDRDLTSLMKTAVVGVARILCVERAGVFELARSGDDLVLRAGAGWDEALVGHASVPTAREAPPGYTLESQAPVVVEDLRRETRFGVPRLLADHGAVAVLNVVIRGDPGPYGVLGADDSRPRRFTRDDVYFLRAVANVLADAIGSAKVEGELQAARDRERRLRQRLERHSRMVVEAQERERRRIAWELHDEIGQTLTGLKLTLEDHDGLSAEAAAVRVARARDLALELLRRVHDLSLDLRPAILDDLGLQPALVWLAQRYGDQTGVHVVLRCSGLDGRLRAEVETAAYRIVQEALTNVARHAGVARAAVECALEDGRLRVEVADDGRGFEVDAVAGGKSSGLAGMEERARSTGGRIWVRSNPGRGTTVVAEFPLS